VNCLQRLFYCIRLNRLNAISVRNRLHYTPSIPYSEEGETIEEQALVERMRSGDPDAYRALVQTHQTYIYQLVFAVVKNRADAEDVTQETFLQIYRSLPLYNEKGLKTWMSRIAVNKAIDHRRRTQRNQEDALPEPNQLAPPDTLSQQFMPPAERILIAQETEQEVHRRLEDVPEGYREIVKAYYFDHKSYGDIAEEQGVAVKTVESKLYRAKQWIRKRWKEEDF
jgi:RNA polymerase sigma factor (sigma-70 family)